MEGQFREIKTEAQHVGMDMLPPCLQDCLLIMEIRDEMELTSSKLDG